MKISTTTHLLHYFELWDINLFPHAANTSTPEVTYRAKKESVINNGEREREKNIGKKHMWYENQWSVTSGKCQYQKVIIKDTQTRIGTGGQREKDKHDRRRKFKMEINKRITRSERDRSFFTRGREATVIMSQELGRHMRWCCSRSEAPLLACGWGTWKGLWDEQEGWPGPWSAALLLAREIWQHALSAESTPIFQEGTTTPNNPPRTGLLTKQLCPHTFMHTLNH